MTNPFNFKRTLATWVALSLCAAMVSALAPPQGLGSGFQGQDIMGGAAIVFKRPQRVRDLLAGSSSLVVVKRSKPKPVEEARNTPPDRRRPPRPRPGETPTEPQLSEADKGEAFKNQG